MLTKTHNEYIKEMENELQEINTENVVAWCKKQLQKHYSEKKLTELEIARDKILEKHKTKN